MSQERMEWLGKIGFRTVEDIRANGPEAVYKLLLEAGHPEDQHFYHALFSAVEDVDTVDIMENIEEYKDGKSRSG